MKLYELNKENEKEIINIIKDREEDSSNILNSVNDILKEVKKNGDKALRYYTKLFDGVDIDNFKVSKGRSEGTEKGG